MRNAQEETVSPDPIAENRRKQIKRKSLAKRLKKQIHKIRSNKKHYQHLVIQFLVSVVVGIIMTFTAGYAPITGGVGRRTALIGLARLGTGGDAYSILGVVGFCYALGVAMGVVMSGYFLWRRGGAYRLALLAIFGSWGLTLLTARLWHLDSVAPLFVMMLLLPPTLGVITFHVFEPDEWLPDDYDDDRE